MAAAAMLNFTKTEILGNHNPYMGSIFVVL